MKKTIALVLVFIMIVAMASSVFAITANELVDEIYARGAKYGLTKADITKMNADIEKRIEANDEITDAEAAAALAKIDEISAILDAKGIDSVSEGRELLTAAEFENVKALAVEAGNAVGVKVTVNVEGNVVKLAISDPVTNTTVLDVAVNKITDQRIHTYTGSTVVPAVVAGIAVIAVAVVAGIKVKKEA